MSAHDEARAEHEAWTKIIKLTMDQPDYSRWNEIIRALLVWGEALVALRIAGFGDKAVRP